MHVDNALVFAAAALLQDREVTVYRLVSKATYEQQLFECASRKYGLDEAILGFGGGEPRSTRKHTTRASHLATSASFRETLGLTHRVL
jgi:hypothetical protein